MKKKKRKKRVRGVSTRRGASVTAVSQSVRISRDSFGLKRQPLGYYLLHSMYNVCLFGR